MAGAYQNGQVPKTTGLMGFHLAGRGRYVQILAEFHRIKRENNSFLGKKMGVGVPSCRAASGAIMKFDM